MKETPARKELRRDIEDEIRINIGLGLLLGALLSKGIRALRRKKRGQRVQRAADQVIEEIQKG